MRTLPAAIEPGWSAAVRTLPAARVSAAQVQTAAAACSCSAAARFPPRSASTSTGAADDGAGSRAAEEGAAAAGAPAGPFSLGGSGRTRRCPAGSTCSSGAEGYRGAASEGGAAPGAAPTAIGEGLQGQRLNGGGEGGRQLLLNHPGNLRAVLRFVAGVRGEAEAEVAAATARNGEHLFAACLNRGYELGDKGMAQMKT